jgi:hypothetical protein
MRPYVPKPVGTLAPRRDHDALPRNRIVVHDLEHGFMRGTSSSTAVPEHEQTVTEQATETESIPQNWRAKNADQPC